MVVLLAAACGLKADPVPYGVADAVERAQPPLSASQQQGAVELAWPAPGAGVRRIAVEKSETGTPGNACRDCPRTYTKIAELTPENENRFRDTEVAKGKNYRYRLELCDETGTCRQSQAVDIDLK